MLPLNGVLLDSSLGIVVHSNWSAVRLRELRPNLPTRRIPLFWRPLTFANMPSNREAARQVLGIPIDAFLVITLGFMTPPKQLPLLISALGGIRKEIDNLQFTMVGEPHPDHPLEQIIKKNGLSEVTAITGYAGLEKFYTYILASDLVVNLRYPSAGETSAALTRALGMGRTAVIFDYGPFSDYPPGVAVKLPLDTQHSEALGEAILDLYRHPEKRLQMERSAQTFIRREHDLSHCTAELAEFTNECHQHRSRPVPLRDTARLDPSKRLNIERCRDLVRTEH